MTPNRTLQKLIKNKAAKVTSVRCFSSDAMIRCSKDPIKSVASESTPGYWQLLISMCTGQYKIKSQCTKTQSVVTTATGHAGQCMAGCSRWQQGQPAQAINRHSNPNTGQPINLQQCERKGGSELYRSLGNHCHSDGVLKLWLDGRILGEVSCRFRKRLNSRKEK